MSFEDVRRKGIKLRNAATQHLGTAMRLSSILLIAVFLSPTAVGAAPAPKPAQKCSSYVGKTIELRSFDEVFAGLTKIPEKGEYESTKDFNERKKKIESANSIEAFVEKQIKPADDMTYDADSGAMKINYSFFHSYNSSWSSQIIYADMYGKVDATSYYNIATYLSKSDDRSDGYYQASNAFGATITVRKSHHETTGVFERKAKSSEETIFPHDADRVVGKIKVSPEDAKALKATAKAALLVAPTWPYLMSGKYQVREPKIDSPYDDTEHFRTIFADIKCGVVLDGSGVVKAAYTAR